MPLKCVDQSMHVWHMHRPTLNEALVMIVICQEIRIQRMKSTIKDQMLLDVTFTFTFMLPFDLDISRNLITNNWEKVKRRAWLEC